MNGESEELVYLYGIVPATAPVAEAELSGLEGAGVALLQVGPVAALVSRVPAAIYSDDALNARLDDLDWVGERGIAHERVLDWYAERGPVIPLSLFSLHRDESRVRERVGADADDLERLLGRLAGHREWGIKLWRRDAIAREGIDRLSPSLRRLGEEIEASPPGKRFLLERKRESMRAEELRAVSKRLAHEFHAALREVAADAAAVPIPGGAAGAEKVLLLHAAYLVADAGFERFQNRVNEQAGVLQPAGFEIEFTGPWPPYHFTAPLDE